MLVVEDIQRLLQPAAPRGSMEARAFERFVMHTWRVVAPPAQALIRSLRVTGEPDVSWPTENLVEMARLSAQAGDTRRAMDCLSFIASHSASTDTAWLTVSLGSDTRGLQYRQELGFAPLVDHEHALTLLGSGDEPVAWFASAAAALAEQIGRQGIDRDRTMTLMAIMAFRLHRAGHTQDAVAVMHSVSAQLAEGDGISAAATTLALRVVEHMGMQLDLAAARSLAATGRLLPAQLADLVARTAQAQDAAHAVRLGEQAAQNTHDDALLGLLASLAELQGDTERASHWRQVRAAAARARTQLNSVGSPQS
jgi:hypothetical protein